MEYADILTELANFATFTVSGKPVKEPRGAEAHTLYTMYLHMVGPQKKLRIYKVSASIGS